MKKSCGIEEWMWEDGEITWETTTSPSSSSSASASARPKPVLATPLYNHFKKVTKQCETFMTGASQMLEGENAQDAGEETEKIVQATSLCGDMLAAREDIERAMVVMGKSPSDPSPPSESEPTSPNHEHESRSNGKGKGKVKGKGKGRDPEIDMQRTYRERCEQLAFQHVEVPGLTTAGRYAYAANVKQTASATRTPKDRVHLIKELAIMATSLPPGIWVRVDETRNDVLYVFRLFFSSSLSLPFFFVCCVVR